MNGRSNFSHLFKSPFLVHHQIIGVLHTIVAEKCPIVEHNRQIPIEGHGHSSRYKILIVICKRQGFIVSLRIVVLAQTDAIHRADIGQQSVYGKVAHSVARRYKNLIVIKSAVHHFFGLFEHRAFVRITNGFVTQNHTMVFLFKSAIPAVNGLVDHGSVLLRFKLFGCGLLNQRADGEFLFSEIQVLGQVGDVVSRFLGCHAFVRYLRARWLRFGFARLSSAGAGNQAEQRCCQEQGADELSIQLHFFFLL